MRIRNLMIPDYRTKKYRELAKRNREIEKSHQRNFWIGVIVTALITGFIIGCLLPRKEVKRISGAVRSVEEVKKVEARGYEFCYDPLTCIRDVGEEMGESNEDIMIMIRLARCESNMNPQAINKNRNGTYDLGLLQINDVHSKRISRQDRLDYEKNIRFAYKLHQEQKHSFNAWSCWRKVK